MQESWQLKKGRDLAPYKGPNQLLLGQKYRSSVFPIVQGSMFSFSGVI